MPSLLDAHHLTGRVVWRPVLRPLRRSLNSCMAPLVCKRGSQTLETELEWTVPHAGVETGPARRPVVIATCVGVAASVLTWLVLNIVWCIGSSNGERLFRRRGFFLKRCSGTDGRRLLSQSVEDAGRERDDSADKNERNGRCEQATSPDPDRSDLRSASLSNAFGSFETTLAPGRNKAPDR